MVAPLAKPLPGRDGGAAAADTSTRQWARPPASWPQRCGWRCRHDAAVIDMHGRSQQRCFVVRARRVVSSSSNQQCAAWWSTRTSMIAV
jgi:hypothetical protein